MNKKQQKQQQQHKLQLLKQSQRKLERQLQINSENSPPPPALLTNKNGLPFKTQKAILENVIRFRGFDEFARDTCDRNPSVFGPRNSKLRKACQDKRRHFVDLHRNHPDKFLALCSEFDTVADFVKKPVPVASSSSTVAAVKNPPKSTSVCASGESSSSSSESSSEDLSDQESFNKKLSALQIRTSTARLPVVTPALRNNQLKTTMTSTRKAIKYSAGKCKIIWYRLLFIASNNSFKFVLCSHYSC
jgi:hypothetical protein